MVLRGSGHTTVGKSKRAQKPKFLPRLLLKSCRDLPTRDIFSSEHWLLGRSCLDETDGWVGERAPGALCALKGPAGANTWAFFIFAFSGGRPLN